MPHELEHLILKNLNWELIIKCTLTGVAAVGAHLFYEININNQSIFLNEKENDYE